jgi:sugar diacid utilization regulator
MTSVAPAALTVAGTIDGRAMRPPAADVLPSEAMSVFSAITMANGSADFGRLLMLVAQGATSLLGVSRCALYLRDDDSGLFQGQCAYGASGIGDAIRRSVCGQEFDGLTSEILATRGPVVVSNARQDPRPVRTAVLEWEVRSIVGAPIVHDDKVIGLIFLDDGRRARAYASRDLKLLEVFANLVSGVIARARETERLRDEAKALNGQNKALQLTLAFGDRLALLAADGAGLNEVAATVAAFTGKACGIYDRHGRRRATALPSGVGEDRRHGFEPSLAAMPEVAEAVARARPGRATVITPTGGDGRTRRLLLLRAPEESAEGGSIILEQGDAQRLHVLDAKVVRRAAAMVDLIVRAEINKAECLRALTADLLLGREDERIPERAEQHGLNLAAPRIVCLLGPRDEDGARVDATAVADAFTQATGEPTRLVVSVGAEVAVVLDLDGSAPQAIGRVKGAVAEALALLPGCDWSAGLSSPCHEAADYPHALGEAQQALRACVEDGEAIVAIDDLGPGHLLTTGIDSARAARFARAVMAPLLEDTSPAGAALITTLETFFDRGRNIRRTAEALKVHENTVRYRLASVLRKTGLDVAGNPRDELTLQLALQLRRDGQRPSQRGGRFSANAAAPSAASAEWNTGIASSS